MPKIEEINNNKSQQEYDIKLEAAEFSEEDNERIRSILLIGRTKSGKSTLANVLVNKNNNFEEVFEESNNTVSGTKNFKVEEAEIDGKNYRIIDTVGFGDTTLEVTKIPPVFEEMDKYIREGADYIFLVVKDVFGSEERNVFKYLKEVFFDEDVINYISIIRTDFSNFEEKEECEKDISLMLTEDNEIIRKITELYKKKIMHIDNPPVNIKGNRGKRENANNREIRELSREKMLSHLKVYQNEKSCKSKLGDLSERIKWMNEKELRELEEKAENIGEWLEKINIFIQWRKELKKEVHNYIESLILNVRNCEFSAEFGKGISQAGKSWTESISNSSVVIAIKGIYNKPIGLAIRLVGDTVEVSSEIIKLIMQRIYEEKLSNKIKEEREKKLLLLRKDLANKVKDCDFKFREELDEEQTNTVFDDFKYILEPLSKKLKEKERDLISYDSAEYSDNNEIDIESLGEERQGEMKVLLSTLIERKVELFFKQIEEEEPLIKEEQEKLELSYNEAKRKAEELKEKLAKERVNFERKMAQIEIPPKQ